jgi:TolB-like protein/Tfp pilus assembly protein PilF
MRLQPGARLGPYEILAPLGAGGMGEVFRARDTRLQREVAVKILPERLADNPHAHSRFEREARVVASLSHPNILALHDFGHENSLIFAVMELLDGEALDRRLARESISWRKAVEIAAAIADGLSAAHAKGIVHRDLKPANVFLTRSGHVKVLDFGLATLSPFDPEGATIAPDHEETDPGVVMGTVGYMAPEQVKGERADSRSDIFSLGCVLYEMLSGRRAFRGDTAAETLAAVLRDRPEELRDSGRTIPPQVDAVVRRCLEKSPDERFQSARDLAFALREILAASSGAPVSGPAATETVPWTWAAIAGTALLVVGLVAAFGLNFGGLRTRLLGGSRPFVQSVVVLPFRNLSGDAEQEYLADAMTEELITDIARLGPVRVISRASAMTLKGTKKSPRQIAQELHADVAIDGSVVRAGSTLKLTAEMVDLSTEQILWADSFERDVRDVLALQREVTQNIARRIGVRLTPADGARLAGDTRIPPEAYDAYVKGRYFLDKRTEADLKKAIAFFRQSLDIDPTNAAAYAGMADCYGAMGYASYVSPEDSFLLARGAAQKALELDPSLADAHAALGYALMYYDWNFPEAEAEFKRAIQLNPGSANAHQWYGYLLTAMERPVAETQHEIAVAKDLDPLSVPIYTDQAYMLYYYGRTDEALKAVDAALAMNPKFPLAYFWLGRIYTSQGRYSEAEAALRHIGPLRTWTPAMATLGYLYAKAGRRPEAEAVLGEFEDLARQGRYRSSYAVAVVYAGLGERERLFQALDAAYLERSHWLVWLKRDPRWDDVRTDPRFVALVRKVGLPS